MAIVRMSLEEIKASLPQIDRAKIDATTDDMIAAQIAADPDLAPDATTLGDPVSPRHIRMKLGLSQAKFAKALHIPVATLRNWEQNRTIPDPIARSLFCILAKIPHEAMAALEG